MITSQSRFQPFLRQLTECLCWGHLGFWSKRKSLRKSTPLLFAHAVAVQLMGQPCFSCTIMVMALKPWKLHAEVGVQNSRCLLFLFFNTSFFFFLLIQKWNGSMKMGHIQIWGLASAPCCSLQSREQSQSERLQCIWGYQSPLDTRHLTFLPWLGRKKNLPFFH